MQHPDKHRWNIRNRRLQHTCANHCNICNILIYFCNIRIKYLQQPLKHLKQLKHMFATRVFSVTWCGHVCRTDTVEAATAIGWRCPTAVELAAVGLLGHCGSGTAVRKDMRLVRPKSLATKTMAWPCASAPPIHYSGTGRICTTEGARRERRLRSEARGWERAACAEWGEWLVQSFCLCDGSMRPTGTGRPNTLNKTLLLLLLFLDNGEKLQLQPSSKKKKHWSTFITSTYTKSELIMD
jgi:hypothetical protein